MSLKAESSATSDVVKSFLRYIIESGNDTIAVIRELIKEINAECFIVIVSVFLTISKRLFVLLRMAKIILLFVGFVAFAAAATFNPDEWQQVKSPLDSPRYQLIMSKIFPTFSHGKFIRGSRIAGGELARLGEFVHQALLLTVDVLGDTYVCGGAIISHNFILSVSCARLRGFR